MLLSQDKTGQRLKGWNLQGDNARPLDESKFCRVHAECDDTRKEDDTHRSEYPIYAIKELASKECEPPFYEDRAER